MGAGLKMEVPIWKPHQRNEFCLQPEQSWKQILLQSLGWLAVGFLNQESGHRGYNQEAAFIDASTGSADSYPKTEPQL